MKKVLMLVSVLVVLLMVGCDNKEVENNNIQQNQNGQQQVNNETENEIVKNAILGSWRADSIVDTNGNELSLTYIFGSGIHESNEMTFKEDGVFSYNIGITVSDADGKYTLDEINIRCGIPTDTEGEYDWRSLTYDTKTNTLKEVFDDNVVVTYVRINEKEITAEMAYEGVNNYCHSEYDWGIAEGNPEIMYVTMGEELASEYQVIFRSYTGTFIYFYVDKLSGTTRMVEYVPNLNVENEAETINLYDYLNENDKVNN